MKVSSPIYSLIDGKSKGKPFHGTQVDGYNSKAAEAVATKATTNLNNQSETVLK
ncbi:hypothetical protein QNI22_11120 [Cytophagaceae bacterium BD1B2-1]|uniref:Uncharacterized protein n=1 Tax=Xanthocytophaga agilis TaxID=3048010 RepID=A0AAE3R4F4_9BACT|nr:hypothetical protein [Xanthocytophaga agilis]